MKYGSKRLAGGSVSALTAVSWLCLAAAWLQGVKTSQGNRDSFYCFLIVTYFTYPDPCYNDAKELTTEPLPSALTAAMQQWCLIKCANLWVMCLFRVWSLGETRLQLSVRNSRDEPPPPPPYPSIRQVEQEVSVCVCVRDCAGQRQRHKLCLKSCSLHSKKTAYI